MGKGKGYYKGGYSDQGGAAAAAGSAAGPAQQQQAVHPLFTAIFSKNVKQINTAVTAMSQNGEDFNARIQTDFGTKPPLHIAVSHGSVLAVIQLLRHGVDITVKGSNDKTPVDLVKGEYYQYPVVKTLIEGHTTKKPSKEELKAQQQVLVNAIKKWSFPEKIESLLKEKPIKFDSQDEGGRTALCTAVESYFSKPELVKLLLEHGADVNLKDRQGNTALCIAVALRHSRTEVVESLLEHGADPNLKDGQGKTALHVACKHQWKWAPKLPNRPAIISLLRQYGADPSIRDDKNNTVLHTAVYGSENPKVLRALLASGVSPYSISESPHNTNGYLYPRKKRIEPQEIGASKECNQYPLIEYGMIPVGVKFTDAEMLNEAIDQGLPLVGADIVSSLPRKAQKRFSEKFSKKAITTIPKLTEAINEVVGGDLFTEEQCFKIIPAYYAAANTLIERESVQKKLQTTPQQLSALKEVKSKLYKKFPALCERQHEQLETLPKANISGSMSVTASGAASAPQEPAIASAAGPAPQEPVVAAAAGGEAQQNTLTEQEQATYDILSDRTKAKAPQLGTAALKQRLAREAAEAKEATVGAAIASAPQPAAAQEAMQAPPQVAAADAEMLLELAASASGVAALVALARKRPAETQLGRLEAKRSNGEGAPTPLTPAQKAAAAALAKVGGKPPGAGSAHGLG